VEPVVRGGPTNGNLIVSTSTGLGEVIVTPLTPIEFAITFQKDLGNANWPAMTVTVIQGGGSNLTANGGDNNAQNAPGLQRCNSAVPGVYCRQRRRLHAGV
jgi:hypothetical protein